MKNIGSETSNYIRRTQNTGIERIIKRIHTDLEPFWRSRDLNFAPITCQKTINNANQAAVRQDLTEAFYNKHLCLEDCDAVLLLDMDNNVDYHSINEFSRGQNIPVVALIHDVLPLTNPQWFPANSKRYFQLFLQQTLHAATHLVVSTQKVKDDILGLGWDIKQEIRVIPFGTSFSNREARNFKAKELSILYVSTVEPRKGHDVLLDAFDILRSKDIDVQLTFVGMEGWMVTDLVQLIQNHVDFGTRLRWFRGAPDEMIVQLAAQSDIGVMPSRGEGFGLFIEEALSLGLQVVASAIPEFLERAQPNLYFSNLDAIEIADTILKVHETQIPVRSQVRSMSQFTYEYSQYIEQIMS